ncbi:MAG: class E sortase [Ilumatobacteraceae bacterium]|nr:class E sortase [Ilumatobacteraceae bacterium]
MIRALGASLVVLTPVLFTGCASNEEVMVSTTSVATSTTTTAAPTTTSTSTTTTVYSGPPTLAPGQSLPQPENIPPEDTVEPEVIVGAIAIPRIDVIQNLYRGVTLPTLDKGVGWWPGTAMPGQVGNVVLGGHRVSKKKPFRNLDQLQPGDEIFLSSADGDFVYVVDRTFIVQPTDVWIIDQTTDATLTLFACHPPGSTRERIVVVANYSRQIDA